MIRFGGCLDTLWRLDPPAGPFRVWFTTQADSITIHFSDDDCVIVACSILMDYANCIPFLLFLLLLLLLLFASLSSSALGRQWRKTFRSSLSLSAQLFRFNSAIPNKQKAEKRREEKKKKKKNSPSGNNSWADKRSQLLAWQPLELIAS